MKGSMVLIDAGRAAFMRNGRLHDLLVDPKSDDPTPRPEAIYRGILARPLKGMHGAILQLPDGQSAFLKDAKGLAPGMPLLVQVSTFADAGKAAPVVRKLLFKSRYAIVTPSNPGINIARSIRDEDERDRLLLIAHTVMLDGGEGLILRSICNGTDGDVIAKDIAQMLRTCRDVMSDSAANSPALLLDAPLAAERGWRDWEHPDQLIDTDGCFADHGVLDDIDIALQAVVKVGNTAWISIEPTQALIAIDVNTGGDFSPAAGLKTNLAATREISRQLLIRGLGGQITIDFAPMTKKDRIKLETALKAEFRRGAVDTILAGWTPLGNMELQRKRERFSLRKAMK
ncbi:MAG: ribonuclease E/G [Paracoccaceae bacterium]